MPSILSRFKRSPSTSSSLSGSDNRHRRSSTVSSAHSNSNTLPSEDETLLSPATSSQSPTLGRSGSHFLEEFGVPVVSPSKQGKHKPEPLALPGNTNQQVLGTPKLVLTEEGSNSPRSFDSNPVVASPRNGQAEGLGIALGAVTGAQPATAMSDDSSVTAHVVEGSSFTYRQGKPTALPVESAPAAGTAVSDDARSGHISIASRVTAKTAPSPLINQNLHLEGSRKTRKKSKKIRALSTSSAKSGIASALAKGGIHLASPTNGDHLMSSAQSSHSKSGPTNRSPFLVRGNGADDASVAHADGDEDAYDDDDDDDDDDTDSDGDGHLPVTGFAVASNKRQADFRGMFSSVDEGDYLIEDYGCALSKDILVQGRLFVSENHLCFHANIFGWVTDVVVAFTDIKQIEKKTTALVIPNAIGVSTATAKYTFASFLSRDTTYDVMMNVWRLCNPNAVMSTTSFHHANGSRPASVMEEDQFAGGGKSGGEGKGHAKTQCACGKEGKHYSETALDATFPSTPEKIYNLMFTSDWYKTFVSDTEKLREIEMSDWKPDEQKHLARSMTYIKPLNGSIGPKQTKCHITDEQEHGDFEEYISMLTTTKTPDVPSGGVFSVKTRTCLTWAGANSTKVVVTTTVEWTGKSWVKGIIEKSAIDGQKQYHDDLDAGIRSYIKEHASEFVGAGGVEDEATTAEEDKANQPSEAEAYAAQQRKERLDKDQTYLQWALDMVMSGFGIVGTGLKTAGEAMSDMSGGKEAVLGLVITLLVLSNIWTYYSVKSGEGAEMRRAKRLGGRSGMGDEEVAEALRMVLQGQMGGQIVPREEAGELRKILDEVERRAVRLREEVDSAVGGEDRD